jgi:phosphatidylinositol 3-kinase
VTWDDPDEAKEALQLIGQWTEISIADSLELLSSHITHRAVRHYAVTQLRKAKDEVIGAPFT